MIKSNTVLAVLEHEGKLYFSGDRRISWGMSKCQKGRSKISYRDNILYAGTGDAALCDEIVELFLPPKRGMSQDPFHYMNTVFMPAMLVYLRDKNYVRPKSRRMRVDIDGKALVSADILVGIDQSLFEVNLDGHCISCNSVSTPYASGCGGAYAYGAILALQRHMKDPKAILTRAIEIASQISPGCGDGIDILNN